MRGTAAKLHLALTGAPDFRGADLRTRLVIAPSAHAVEEAFNPVKYGALLRDPGDGDRPPLRLRGRPRPAGHHVLSAIVQFAPSRPEGGWDAHRAAFLDRILATLEAHAPGIGALVAAAELVTPADLETRYGMIGGNWHHGELAVERMLFLRPTIGAAQYAAADPRPLARRRRLPPGRRHLRRRRLERRRPHPGPRMTVERARRT